MFSTQGFAITKTPSNLVCNLCTNTKLLCKRKYSRWILLELTSNEYEVAQPTLKHIFGDRSRFDRSDGSDKETSWCINPMFLLDSSSKWCLIRDGTVCLNALTWVKCGG